MSGRPTPAGGVSFWRAVLLGLLLAFGGVAGAAAPRTELVIGITQFPSTFNPNIDSMVAKSYVLALTRRPITVYDKDWQLVCLLCTELPSIENGGAVVEPLPADHPEVAKRQGVAVTFTLRPDAVWGDGTPVTTEDVRFTYAVGRHPMSGVASAELYKRILSLDIKDKQRFTLHLDRLSFAYNAINDFQLLPAHLERPAFENPAEYRLRTRYDTDTVNPGLYFGPYRIAEVVSGSHIVLLANPTWWGRKPAFQRIVVRVIENTAALEANLLSGSIDYIAGELGLTLDQALALEKRHGPRFDFHYKVGLIYEHIDLNLDNPVLADRAVRQALLLALDRDQISQRLFAGRQPVARGQVSPLDWVHGDDLPAWAHDPARAKALLDAAGWSELRNGIRYNGKGEKLSFELMTTAGNRSRELVQQVLQSQWKAVGIEIRIRNQPARVFFGETVSRRQFDAMAMFAWVSSPENVPRSTLHSSMIPTPANNFSGQNYTGFASAEMDALIDRIELELDRDKRKALWHRLQAIYGEELPALPLYFRADSFVIPKWLKGVEPTGHQYPSTLWVENWRAE